jgi:hypothetical protein
VVEEGETEGGADAVPTISTDNAQERAGSGKTPMGSTLRPWITAIARR